MEESKNRQSPNLMLAKASKGPSRVSGMDDHGQYLPHQLAQELLSVTGSDCFVEFPGMLDNQEEELSSGKDVIGVNDINFQLQPQIDTQGFGNKDADGPLGQDSLNESGKGKFYETAKFNPRSLIDLVEQTVSSCNEAEDEAHLPEIQFFNQSSRMRFRSIKQVDENSHRLAKRNPSDLDNSGAMTASQVSKNHDPLNNRLSHSRSLSQKSLEKLQQPIRATASLQMSQYTSLEAARGPLIQSHQVVEKEDNYMREDSPSSNDKRPQQLSGNEPKHHRTQHVYIYANEVSIKFDNNGNLAASTNNIEESKSI